MKHRFLIITLLLLFGCNTNIFQPVKKQIIGTWVVVPTEREIEKWHIDGTNIVVTIDDIPVDTSAYSLENKLSKHIMNAKFDAQLASNASLQEEWHIVHLNKDEMYISSIDPPRISNVQISFVKE